MKNSFADPAFLSIWYPYRIESGMQGEREDERKRNVIHDLDRYYRDA